MKPFIEFEGKSVEKAIESACAKYKLKKDQLKYDVISSGSTGIFGLVGAKKAKIRVILPESHSSEAAAQTKDSGRSKPSSEGVQSLVDEAFNGFEFSVDEEEVAIDVEDETENDVEHFAAELPSEEALEKGKEALEKILDLITDDTHIEITPSPERVLYSITGGNSAILIGKRGQTLEAIQYILDKVVNKHSNTRVRIQLDIEGYLETRRASLESLALRLAEKVKRTKKPSTISQMTAHDRRIVHLALKDNKSVRTQSMGSGFYRKLVIMPKKSSGRKRRNSPKRNQNASS